MPGLRPFRTIPENLREWTRWMEAQDIPDAADLSGDDAISTFVASVYQRSASAPATPSANSASYNFTTQVLTPPVGWFENAPASDGNPLYVSSGSFDIIGVEGIDSNTTWSTPALIAQDGETVFVANAFLRKSTAPSTPAVDDGSYNFTTNTLTPPKIATGSAEDWFTAPPAGTDALYVTSGSFSIVGQTGTDETTTWTSPDLLVSDGVDGDSVFVANVYKRSASAPATPSVNDGQYNFTTNTLTPPSTWSVEAVAGANPLYVSSGSFSISGATGTDTTVTWTAPDLLVQDGATGATGAAGADGADGDLDRIRGVGKNLVHVSSTPTNAHTSFKVDNDGDVYTKTGTGSYASIGTWLLTGVVADYQCRLRIESGPDTPTGSASDSWLDCSTDRNWNLDESVSNNTKQFDAVIEWRDDTTLEILASATADQFVNEDPG